MEKNRNLRNLLRWLAARLSSFRRSVVQWFANRKEKVRNKWEKAWNPTTDTLTKIKFILATGGFFGSVVGGMAGCYAIWDHYHPKPDPVPEIKSGNPRKADLHVARLTLEGKNSYFEKLADTPSANHKSNFNPPGEFISLGSSVEDTWVPSTRWYVLRDCLSHATVAKKRRCGPGAQLLPVFDVLVENLGEQPTTIRSLRLVVRRAEFPQGDSPGALGIPPVAIPKSAAYEMKLHPDFMASEDRKWRKTTLDLLPPLNVASGVPARFSLRLNFKSPDSPTTALLHLEVIDSSGVVFLSPPFTLYLP